MITREQETRFWSHTRAVQRHMDTPCIEWHGAISKSQRGEGYGNVKIDGRNYKAHVIGFLLQFGHMPKDGNVVMHQCDNRRCVYHLEEGTQSDNMIDMFRKGRHVVASGELNPGSKLTAEMVTEIYEMAHNGVSHADIADKINRVVSLNQIQRIVSGKAWRHITINLNVPKEVDEITLNVGVDEEE